MNTLKSLYDLIKSDPYACSFQTLGSYRSALLKVIERVLKESSWKDPSTVPNDGEFLIGVWSGDWNNPCQRFTVFHAHGTPTGPSWSMKSNYRTEEGGVYKIAGWMNLPDKI
jgi:hypothetical protein